MTRGSRGSAAITGPPVVVAATQWDPAEEKCAGGWEVFRTVRSEIVRVLLLKFMVPSSRSVRMLYLLPAACVERVLCRPHEVVLISDFCTFFMCAPFWVARLVTFCCYEWIAASFFFFYTGVRRGATFSTDFLPAFGSSTVLYLV